MSGRDALSTRLHGTHRGHVVQEFFSNTAHFPVALILLEMLIYPSPLAYMGEVDFYVLVFSSLAQAYWLGSREYQGRPVPLLGNLVAPSLYTLAEIGLDGMSLDFFDQPYHQAYWVFAILVGLIQHFKLRAIPPWRGYLTLLENLTRTGILVVMYAIFEHLAPGNGTEYRSLAVFFADNSHIFITLSLLFIGIMLGLANQHAENFLYLLRETSQQLRMYSEWLLGKNILAEAMNDPASLSLSRRQRCVLFMDIRGFTHWSESQPPEQVVAMLNRYFETAETCWSQADTFPQVIKVKLTGDEVMIVFTTVAAAVQTAALMHNRVGALLRQYGLGAGTGIHYGPLVEGLLGSGRIKNYDIIGDTVNTAKRICDVATAGEVLLSTSAREHAGATLEFGPSREVSVKGKTTPIVLYPVHAGWNPSE